MAVKSLTKNESRSPRDSQPPLESPASTASPKAAALAPVRTYGEVELLRSGKGENFARVRGLTHAGGKAALFVIKCEPHVAMRLKDLFRRLGKDAKGSLYLSVAPDVAKDLAWFLSRYPMRLSREAQRALESEVWSYDARQSDLERLTLPNFTPREFKLSKPLRDYQARAVEIYLRGKRLLCADDMGLGKTLVTLGSFSEKATLPALVCCQTHLPTQWAEKVSEFTPNLRTHIIKSRRPYDLPEADVYIMSYSKLTGWEDILSKGFFRSVTFDECQELRIPESQKYQAALLASRHAEYCLGLSATPIYNYGSEIWSVLDMIKEGALGSYEEFRREWCAGGFSEQDRRGRVLDPHALGSYLRENFLMLRRTRAEVGRELPPVIKILHPVEYNAVVARDAHAKVEQLAARVISGPDKERGQASRELNTMARMMTGIAKAASVAEYVRVLLENGEKVMLMGWHREVYSCWMDLLSAFNPVLYTGSESPAQKQAAKDAFMDGTSPLLIMSLRAGAGIDGLQYSGGKVVVFGELDWSPAVHQQVITRLDRDRSDEVKNQITAVFLHCEEGTDPLMIDLLGLKASQAYGIVNPGASDVVSAQAEDDRYRLLAEQILKKKR